MPSRLDRLLMAGLMFSWFAWLLPCPPLAAQDSTEYQQHIKPLLAARCIACHGVLKQEAGLRLDTAELARQGSASGPVIVAGDLDKSTLLKRVTATDPSERMPPEGEPLTAEQIQHLSTWIKAGAAAPADEQPEADPREHWAFKQIQRPIVPTLPETWGTNPIDAFVAAGHRAHGLKDPLPANRREQINGCTST